MMDGRDKQTDELIAQIARRHGRDPEKDIYNLFPLNPHPRILQRQSSIENDVYNEQFEEVLVINVVFIVVMFVLLMSLIFPQR